MFMKAVIVSNFYELPRQIRGLRRKHDISADDETLANIKAHTKTNANTC